MNLSNYLRPWTPIEDFSLRSMREKGKGWQYIAQRLCRTVKGVQRRYESLTAERTGRRAFEAGRPCVPPSGLTRMGRDRWLKGWLDAEFETRFPRRLA